MKVVRRIAILVLVVVAAASLAADFLSPHGYAVQFRERTNEPPSRTFLLGTDDLGRDRFARLLQGSRVSLLCAPAAALVSTLLAAAVGLLGGYFGRSVNQVLGIVTDLFLSLPWLFALLTLRAVLPLDLAPSWSIAATFLLLAAVGWASGARVVRAAVAGMRDSGAILHARAYGCGGVRLLWFHILPNLWPVMAAQFWILVPVFLLTDANLGMLGLGVTEPLPSWGNMLAELQEYHRIPDAPWILAPAFLLIAVVASLHYVVSGSTTWE